MEEKSFRVNESNAVDVSGWMYSISSDGDLQMNLFSITQM